MDADGWGQPRPLLLTVEDAARLLAVGRTAVYQLISNGSLASVRIGGSRRISLAALEEFVARLQRDDASRR